MKTIDPLELEARIHRGDRFELIDVRAREDFQKIHAFGARSLPLAEFRAKKVLRERTLPASEPLYIMCREKALAELAAESLEADGCENAIIVKGGIKAWVHHGLPVVRRERWQLSIESHAAAVLAGLAVGLGLVVHDFFFLLAFLVVVWWAIPCLLRSRRTWIEDLNLAALQLRQSHS